MMLSRTLSKIFFYFASAVFAFMAATIAMFYYFGQTIPSETTLLAYSPPTTTRIFSSRDELIEEYAIERREIVPFDKIPTIVKGAFLIAEDHDFYEHSGINLQSLIKAIIENTVRKSWNKRPAGGSTITQQIAKNLLVGSERSFCRKIREAIMAFRIESTICKDKIFEIYLNQLYLGKGRYGIVEACNYYFEKPIDKIAAHEVAFLAAITNAPSIYIDAKNTDKVLSKRNSILCQLYELGYISKDELRTAIAEPINIKKREKTNKMLFSFFSDEIFKTISKKLSVEAFLKNGYRVKTTADSDVQLAATKAFEDGLIAYAKTRPYAGSLGNMKNEMISPTHARLSNIDAQLPATINKIASAVITATEGRTLICENSHGKTLKIQIPDKFYHDANLQIGDIILCRALENEGQFELYQQPDVTGGMVVMDPSSGDILAMTGGFSFDIGSFNCVTQAQRQPGSTIKPFVCAAALEQGWADDDIIEDKPVSVVLPSGERYAPSNYKKNEASSKIPMRDCVVYSKNRATVNLALQVGLRHVADIFKKAGLVKNRIPISAVLGSIEITPLNLISAFSAFFNNGIMISPRFITSVEQAGQKVDAELWQTQAGKQVMSQKTAEIVKDILHDVVRRGTAASAAALEMERGVEICGKTGTTNDFKDAWFVGSVADNEKRYLVCVFVGHNAQKSLGEHMSGARVALPIFINFVRLMFDKSHADQHAPGSSALPEISEQDDKKMAESSQPGQGQDDVEAQDAGSARNVTDEYD